MRISDVLEAQRPTLDATNCLHINVQYACIPAYFMIITICNQKGGAGKTTLTLLLAMALESVGRTVAIIDRDPQQTSSRAVTHLRSSGVTKIELTTGAEDFEVTFIDTAPRLDDSLAKAIRESDRVLLVSSPSPADLWSTQQSREFVEKNLRPGAKTAILFNSVVTGAKISRDLHDLATHIGLPALKNCVGRRQSYQYAVLQGWDILRTPEKMEIQSAALEIGTM